jgi:hypothetical protein
MSFSLTAALSPMAIAYHQFPCDRAVHSHRLEAMVHRTTSIRPSKYVASVRTGKTICGMDLSRSGGKLT